HRLTPVVYHRGQVQRLASAAAYLHAPPQAVHLKLDSGMGRLGAPPREVEALAQTIHHEPLLRLHALMTHLACADEPSFETTERQMALFTDARQALQQRGYGAPLAHAANSAALLRIPTTQLDLTRPGIALFGIHPCSSAPSRSARRANLKPAMRVLSEVVALRDVPRGGAIGYGHRWRATRPSRIATLPMGYADGLSRALSGRGAVLIDGKRAPVVGAVSMDLTTVDVTDHPGVKLHDEVVILGEQRGRLGHDTIGADEIAQQCDTIAWECLTNISRRVPRYYRQP
ncbi:MAG TPA: alanine racemase, partial [Sorangium sp.]|nr:alanine racemase [Sorangium sp.]